MILKSFCFWLVLVILDVQVSGYLMEYTYDDQAGGWLKVHKAATREDAALRCDSEEAILVSPVNSRIRDAVQDYLMRVRKPGLTIMSGVQLNFSSAIYHSIEGVSLNKMPVLSHSIATNDNSREDCVKWMTGQSKVATVSCSVKLPLICYKKKTVDVIGCATLDPYYKYDIRSGSCYKFHRVAQTWVKAYQICKRENGYLAIINNDLESVMLRESFTNVPATVIVGASDANNTFVGIRDWLDGEGWKTVKGMTITEAGYSKWASGQPGKEHCGAIHKKGKYNDVNCNKKFAFICEKTPEFINI